MEIGLLGWIFIIAGAVFTFLWIILYFAGLKHNSMFDVLEEKDFPFKEVYGMGYAFLKLINYGYKGKADRKLRQHLEILYGEKYSEYYLRVIRSQQITLSITLFVFSFSLYGLTAEIVAPFVGFAFAALAFYYFGTVTAKKISKRSESMLNDFSEVVSKLALLTNAGMILREAWQEVAYAGEGDIYIEMRTAVDEMNNGVADVDAVYNFGTRCIIPEVKKFTSTIIQGMTKGNSELTAMMQQQSKEVWSLKKQLVRRAGEKAASKLLLPICIMFVGILIMIVVPIFTNLGV